MVCLSQVPSLVGGVGKPLPGEGQLHRCIPPFFSLRGRFFFSGEEKIFSQREKNLFAKIEIEEPINYEKMKKQYFGSAKRPIIGQ